MQNECRHRSRVISAQASKQSTHTCGFVIPTAVRKDEKYPGFAGASTGGISGFYGRTGNAVLKSTDNIVFNNATASGTVQAANVTVTGDLTVNGTTTTVDT